MISFIELKFFEKFGIKPHVNNIGVVEKNTYETVLEYPKITDSILIELIKLISDGYGYLYCKNTHTTGFRSKEDCIMVESADFKEGILTLILQPRVQLRIDKKKVRALFEDMKNEEL